MYIILLAILFTIGGGLTFLLFCAAWDELIYAFPAMLFFFISLMILKEALSL